MHKDLYSQIKKLTKRDTDKPTKRETVIRLSIGAFFIILGVVFTVFDDFISEIIVELFHNTAVITLGRMVTCLVPIGIGIILLLGFIPSSKVRRKVQKFYFMFVIVGLLLGVLAAILIATGLAT